MEPTKRFVKVATSAGLSFAVREYLVQRTDDWLDTLVFPQDMDAVGQSDKIFSALFSNVVRNPFDLQFRCVNLDKRLIAECVTPFPPAWKS